MGKQHYKAILPASVILAACMPFTSLADTAINRVSLYISSEITADEDGGDVDVSTDSGTYDVDDVEIRNEPSDQWEEGDEPRIRITLDADSGYYFSSSISESDIELSGDGGDVTDISRSRDTLRIYVTLDALEADEYSGDYDLEVSDLEIDDTDGTVYWDGAEDARRYEVRLYRDGESITSIKSTTDTDYNFSSKFTKSGDYKFRVRAVRNSSNKGNWAESEEIYISSSEAREIRRNGSSSGPSSASTSGGPGVVGSGTSAYGPGVSSSSTTSSSGPGASSGAWMWDTNVNRWWYCNPDRSYTVNNWQYINNYWYYFDGQGYMVTGWILWNGIWYYCCDNGEMLTNTRTPDGYYVGGDGAWIQ